MRHPREVRGHNRQGLVGLAAMFLSTIRLDPRRAPAKAAKRSSPADQRSRLCEAHYEVVEVAPHLEST
jgi:hypothetical protein